MPASVADTHAHLDMLSDPGLSLARCSAAHLDFVVTVVDPSEDHETYAKLAMWREDAQRRFDAWDHDGVTALDGRGAATLQVPPVRVLLGVHPHNAKGYTKSCEQTLIKFAAHPLTAGIGEIGLDYHYDFSPRALQREVFARQVELAQKMKLPIALHLREAHDEGLAILQREGVPEAGCVLHCFNLDYETLKPFLDLGCYIAFGGPLTFKKSHEVRDAATRVPLDRLLTETDAPYMSPEPLRGMPCGPEHTIFTADMLYRTYSDAHPEYADKAGFLQAVFDNALGILDREPSMWQCDEHAVQMLFEQARACISDEEARKLYEECSSNEEE
ncbi:MAG: TatD family hydrolase [Actinobacteria bacterium]|nr:TatD family hydrolase [Actinomycetota bacterium]